MARKIMLIRLLSEYRSHATVTNRRPVPRPPALYLMQLREKLARHQSVKRPQRVAITTDWQNGAEVALPIRINHQPTGSNDIPVVIG